MPIKEPHESDARSASGSIPSHASDWLQQFVKLFEWDFVDAVALLPSPDESDFRRIALVATMRTLQDSGLSLEAIIEMFGQIANGQGEEPIEWTSDLNARRFALIDKEIQGELTPSEQFELARLTHTMRRVVETEANLPMDGARELHRKLMGTSGSA